MEKSLELKEKENKGKKGICRIELQVYGTLEKRVEFKQLKATRCLFSFEIEILDLASQKEIFFSKEKNKTEIMMLRKNIWKNFTFYILQE